jgi:hypothetical protein
VREAFKAKGHYAMSCDLLPTEIQGEHYQGDVLEVLGQGRDLMIAHPPCTYLSYAGNVWINKQPERRAKQLDAFEFFMKLANAPIHKICIENPLGVPRKLFRKECQIIEPYQFGHNGIKKRTCLWLNNLPLLNATSPENEKPIGVWDGKRYRQWIDRGNHSAKNRSKTFKGIADAMASQWG